MIFFANRANLDRRTLLRRLHDRLGTQVAKPDGPVTQVQYETSAGNKVGVRAAIAASRFLGRTYTIEEAELVVSFDFPPDYSYDFYRIQWVEPERDLMLGWHQDETHMDLGPCHFQIDYRGETVQRETARVVDEHPMNVFDTRLEEFPAILEELSWDDDRPSIPPHAVK